MRIQFKVWRSAAADVRGGKPKRRAHAHHAYYNVFPPTYTCIVRRRRKNIKIVVIGFTVPRNNNNRKFRIKVFPSSLSKVYTVIMIYN